MPHPRLWCPVLWLYLHRYHPHHHDAGVHQDLGPRGSGACLLPRWQGGVQRPHDHGLQPLPRRGVAQGEPPGAHGVRPAHGLAGRLPAGGGGPPAAVPPRLRGDRHRPEQDRADEGPVHQVRRQAHGHGAGPPGAADHRARPLGGVRPRRPERQLREPRLRGRGSEQGRRLSAAPHHAGCLLPQRLRDGGRGTVAHPRAAARDDGCQKHVRALYYLQWRRWECLGHLLLLGTVRQAC
mmetsp:Transcript_60583/g.177112  ORF Transcript_60583/g.177112 Transcript_60583/m.177112 type:complete len:237 (+) Transcript_60583:107-817(+)